MNHCQSTHFPPLTSFKVNSKLILLSDPILLSSDHDLTKGINMVRPICPGITLILTLFSIAATANSFGGAK